LGDDSPDEDTPVRTVLTISLLVTLAAVCPAQNAPREADSVETQPPPAADKGKEAKPAPQPPAKGKGKATPAPTAEPPAADKGKAKPPAAEKGAEKGAADPEAPAMPKSMLPPPSTVYAEIGVGDWGLSGSRSKFREYATIPSGIFLRDLRYAPMLRSPKESAFFDIKGIGQDDYRAETRLVANYGASQASGFLSRYRFFDPLPNPVDGSSRHTEGFNVKQSLFRDFALSLRYRNDTQHNNFAVPFSNLDQNTEYWDAVASGKLGRGFATLNYSSFHFSDHTGTLVNSTTQTAGLSYLWNPSDAIGLEAAYSHVDILQPSLPKSHLDIVSLAGDIALGSKTDLNLRFQQRNLGLPNVQSAFVRAQSLGSASLFHRWKSWRAQVGVRLQNDERVNGDQTFVDVPKWSTVEGRLSGKLLAGLRLTVRGYTQSLTNPPSAITDDTASLYWSSRNYVQAKLEGGPPTLNYYLVYTYQAKRNSARASDVQTTQYTVGSVWQISPALSLFGEYHHENWSGKTDFDAFPTLNNFLPDTTTGIVELTYNHGPLFLSASYTGFGEQNDNPLLLQDGNAHGSFITLTGRYRFPRGYELGLTVAPVSYGDNVVGALNYNAAVVMVTGSARF